MQNFALRYGDAVDSNEFMGGSGLKYYSKDVVFHNQNEAEYYGREQMWVWDEMVVWAIWQTST